MNEALRYVLLAALFLFLYRVVRVVGDDLRAAGQELDRPWAVLLVEEGPGMSPGEAFAVRGEALVGRGTGNDVTVPDPEAGLRHARLVGSGDSFWVEDLGSPAGTYLNGRRLEVPAPVRHGDRVRVGSTVFRFLQPRGPQAAGG
ncbi:MAG: FHA domain-containing protein [Armatimonadota bacterium]|nr:FHA domain-containing protein [Armatimonadota bacterium]